MTTYIESVVYFVAFKIYASMKKSLVFQLSFFSSPEVFCPSITITVRKASLLDMRVSDCSTGLAFLAGN